MQDWEASRPGIRFIASQQGLAGEQLDWSRGVLGGSMEVLEAWSRIGRSGGGAMLA